MTSGKRLLVAIVAAAGLALLVFGGWLLMRGREEAPPPPVPPPPTAHAPAAPSPDARLAAARRAVFRDGPVLRDENGRDVRFEDSRLIDAPFGPVLVSAGEVVDASHAEGGRVAIHYLAAAGAGFTVARTFPDAVVAGSHGAFSSWSISEGFTALPVVAVEGGGTFQGYTCTILVLTQLRPEGPAEIATVPIHSDDEGAAVDRAPRTLTGRIANIRRGQSFDVVFTGSERFTEHYAWRDARFVRAGGESRATC